MAVIGAPTTKMQAVTTSAVSLEIIVRTPSLEW
jgi:hypothetical protein